MKYNKRIAQRFFNHACDKGLYAAYEHYKNVSQATISAGVLMFTLLISVDTTYTKMPAYSGRR